MEMAKIVIIDDDPSVRKVLTKYLSLKGHNVLTAPDGFNAIALVKNNLPDAVILDIKLPYADGKTVLKKIKEISRSIIVIILTGYEDDSMSDYYRDMGANLFISKSEGMSNIVEKIESLIGLKEDLETPSSQDVLTENISDSDKNLMNDEKMKKILVADDEDNIRKVLARFLSKLNYRVLEAKDGKEVLEIIEKEDIFFLLLDIAMPGLNGIDILNYLNSSGKKINVVMITGNEDEEVARQTLKLGAVDYFKKPINLKNLELLIKTVELGSEE